MNFYVDYLEFFGYKRQLHIDRVRYTRGDKIYEQILLRESYRARRCGIEKALGTHQNGKLALWQVIARTLFQGSRLSAVRQAKRHGAAEILGFKEGRKSW